MFNFTHEERRVILFLCVIALIGSGVNFLIKIAPPTKAVVFLDRDFGKLNLNLADQAALENIPGIGAKTAERIILYRQQQHGFRDLAELKNIKGIYPAKFEKIKDHLTLK